MVPHLHQSVLSPEIVESCVRGCITYVLLPPFFRVPTNQQRDLFGYALVPDVPVLVDVVPEVAEGASFIRVGGFFFRVQNDMTLC